MPGPAPKHPSARARRNAAPQTTTLPAAGRGAKRAPAWPLEPDIQLQVDRRLADLEVKQLRAELAECDDGRARRRVRRQLDTAVRTSETLKLKIQRQTRLERKLWTELWKTPQAVMWEKLAWHRDVAQYVRHKVRAECGSLKDAAEARQWSDRLGLNPLAMLRLRWENERTEAAEQRGKERRERAVRPAGQPRPDPRKGLYAIQSS